MMTLKDENKTLRLICEIQQRAIRHYETYSKYPEDSNAVESMLMGAANASNARQMCDLLAIPSGEAPDRDQKEGV